MRIIQIKTGISINAEKIEAVEDVNGLTCKIYIGSHIYESTYPYSTLVSLLRTEPESRLTGFLEKQQFWAG